MKLVSSVDVIDISRDKQLRKELLELHEKIKCQVYLVQNLVGRDFKSDRYVLLNIDRVYEMIDETTNIPHIVIISHGHDRINNNKHFFSAVYIKKELFDMTEEQLRANKERLSKELKETNQKQLLEKVLNHDRR
mgnify:CR=1 FL=1